MDILRCTSDHSKVIAMCSGVWKIWNGNSMYMMRGTPGRWHPATGSAVSRAAAFSARFIAAHG